MHLSAAKVAPCYGYALIGCRVVPQCCLVYGRLNHVAATKPDKVGLIVLSLAARLQGASNPGSSTST